MKKTTIIAAIFKCARLAFGVEDEILYDAVSTGQHQPWIGTLDTGLIYQVTPNFSVDVDSFFGHNHSAPDYNVFVGFGRRF